MHNLPVEDLQKLRDKLVELAESQNNRVWQLFSSGTKTHEEAMTYLDTALAFRDTGHLIMVGYGTEEAPGTRLVALIGDNDKHGMNVAAAIASLQPALMVPILENYIIMDALLTQIYRAFVLHFDNPQGTALEDFLIWAKQHVPESGFAKLAES